MLTRTDRGGALTEKSEGALRRFQEEERQRPIIGRVGTRDVRSPMKHPKLRVAPFPELLGGLRGGLSIDISNGGGGTPGSQAYDLFLLHEFRNALTHFEPHSWTIEIAGLPRIVRHALDLTDRIRHSDFANRNRFNYEVQVDDVIGRCRIALDTIDGR